MYKKIYFFLFLLSFLQKNNAQNVISRNCAYDYEKKTDSITLYDLSIHNLSNKKVFEWSNQIGKSVITTGKDFQVKCFQTYCTFDAKDSVIYAEQEVYQVLIDTSTCQIISEKSFINDVPSKNPTILASEYKRNKKYSKKNKRISPRCENIDYIMMYMHDLEIASLKGDAACEKLFFSFEEDFGKFMGASGVEEYRGNILLVYELKYRKSKKTLQQYHIKNYPMQRLLSEDNFFDKKN